MIGTSSWGKKQELVVEAGVVMGKMLLFCARWAYAFGVWQLGTDLVHFTLMRVRPSICGSGMRGMMGTLYTIG